MWPEATTRPFKCLRIRTRIWRRNGYTAVNLTALTIFAGGAPLTCRQNRSDRSRELRKMSDRVVGRVIRYWDVAIAEIYGDHWNAGGARGADVGHRVADHDGVSIAPAGRRYRPA